MLFIVRYKTNFIKDLAMSTKHKHLFYELTIAYLNQCNYIF